MKTLVRKVTTKLFLAFAALFVVDGLVRAPQAAACVACYDAPVYQCGYLPEYHFHATLGFFGIASEVQNYCHNGAFCDWSDIPCWPGFASASKALQAARAGSLDDLANMAGSTRLIPDLVKGDLLILGCGAEGLAMRIPMSPGDLSVLNDLLRQRAEFGVLHAAIEADPFAVAFGRDPARGAADLRTID